MLVSLAWLMYIHTKKLLIFSCYGCLALVKLPYLSHVVCNYCVRPVPSRSVPTPNFRWIFLRVQLTMLSTRPFTGVVHRAWSQSQVSAHLSVSLYLLIFSAGCSALCLSGTYCCFCWTKRKQRTPCASAYPSTNIVLTFLSG